jgi:hypothetical protein
MQKLTKRQSLVVVCDDEASPFFNQAINGVLNQSLLSNKRLSKDGIIISPIFKKISAAHRASQIADTSKVYLAQS